MGDRTKSSGTRAKVLVLFSICALAGGALAAALTTAQGPGDYEPSTVTTTVTATTSTTTLPSGETVEIVIKLNLTGTAGTQKVGANIVVIVKATAQERRRQVTQPILVSGHGKVALKVEPGGRGKRCLGRPKGKEKKWKLGTDFKTISNGGKTKLKLKVPKSARKTMNKQIICKDSKAKAKVRIDASDAFGAEGTKDRTVKLRPNDKSASAPAG